MYHSVLGKPSLRVVLVMGLLMGLCSLLLLAACGGEEKKGATGGTQNGESLKEALRSEYEKVGEMQSESKSVDLEIHNRGPGQGKYMTFAVVHLKMGAGELNVTGGADPQTGSWRHTPPTTSLPGSPRSANTYPPSGVFLR